MKKIFPHRPKFYPKSEWTLIFLIAIDETPDSLKALNLFISSIYENNSKISTIFCVKGISKVLNQIIRDNNLGNTLKEDNNSSTALFFSNKKLIKGQSLLIFTEKNYLQFFLKKIVSRKYPARKYSIFTLDHGCAYGTFREDIKDGVKHSKLKLLINGKPAEKNKFSSLLFYTATLNRERVENISKSRLTKERLPDVIDFRILTMTELKESIRTSLKRVDTIVMINCLMQFFDTGFALGKVADKLIACEGSMNANPINFTWFYEHFIKTDLSSENFSNWLINAIDCYPDNASLITEEERSQIAGVFVNHLPKYSLLAQYLDKLAEKLSILIADKETFELIYTARQNCHLIHGSGSLYVIDLFKLCEELKKTLANLDNALLIEIINKILDLQYEIVDPQKYIGSGMTGKNLNGISIFFPLNSRLNDSITVSKFENPTSPLASSFTKKYRWDSFLTQYKDQTKRFDKFDIDPLD